MLDNILHNTKPQIVHAPDDASHLWHRIKHRFEGMSPKSYAPNKDLAIITWNNLKEGYCEASLKKNGVPFTVLGKDVDKWCNLMKFTLNVDFLSKLKAPYCMGLDSHDVIAYGDPNICLQRFLKMNCDLVFNAEMKFYPDYPLAYFQNCKEFEENLCTGKFCYLNSGAWIGKRDFCLQFFSECSPIKLWEQFDCRNYPKTPNCDQSVVHGMFKKHWPRVKLDYTCEIFQNIAKVTNEVVISFKCLI